MYSTYSLYRTITHIHCACVYAGQSEAEVGSDEDLTTTNHRTYSRPQTSALEEDDRETDCHSEHLLYLYTYLVQLAHCVCVVEFTGAGYQDSTHFQFGNHNIPSSSVYTGGLCIHIYQLFLYVDMYSLDFSMESVRGAKRERAVSPPSAKVEPALEIPRFRLFSFFRR